MDRDKRKKQIPDLNNSLSAMEAVSTVKNLFLVKDISKCAIYYHNWKK